jgi:ABC-2 type transport system permease protein
LRSPDRGSARALFAKELRELFASRSALLVALAAGPLVAHAFSTALDSYAEASGVPGGAAALTQAMSPLDGFVSPVFGAYSVIATLLFPFVAIRSVSAEKESGGHLLMLQGPHRVTTLIGVKFLVLMIAWVAIWTPGLVALGFWSAAGGHLDATETVGVLAGHFVRGTIVASLGIACAALAESGASASVLALGATLGAWAVDFTAAVRGGIVESIARFTPDSMLRTFEHGDVQLSVIAVAALLASTFLLAAVIQLDPSRPRIVRGVLLGAVVVEIVAALFPAAGLRATWDLSEDQRNSFHPADVAALATITTPVHVTVYLGPEDPRRADLERSVLRKLRRTLPKVTVTYAAQSATGLFEGPGSKYGEVWYEVGDRREMNRSSVESIALAPVYQLAGRAEPERGEATYPGYPLRVRASLWQLLVLAVAWPLAVLGGWLAFRRTNDA